MLVTEGSAVAFEEGAGSRKLDEGDRGVVGEGTVRKSGVDVDRGESVRLRAIAI